MSVPPIVLSMALPALAHERDGSAEACPRWRRVGGPSRGSSPDDPALPVHPHLRSRFFFIVRPRSLLLQSASIRSALLTGILAAWLADPLPASCGGHALAVGRAVLRELDHTGGPERPGAVRGGCCSPWGGTRAAEYRRPNRGHDLVAGCAARAPFCSRPASSSRISQRPCGTRGRRRHPRA